MAPVIGHVRRTNAWRLHNPGAEEKRLAAGGSDYAVRARPANGFGES